MKRILSRVSAATAALLALSLLIPTTALAAPAAPSNLTAAIGGPSQVHLTWLDNSTDEKEFQIDRADDAAFAAGLRSFKANDVAGTGNTVTFDDNSVAAGQTFFYRVLAVDNDKVASAPSNTVQVDFVKPAGPTNLAAVAAGPNRVELTWVDNAVNETSYDVDRDTQASFATRVSFEFQPAGSTSFTDTGVQPDTTYFYRVQAVNAVGDSVLSNVASVTTPAVPTTPPSAPTGLVATAVSATQVSLTWADSSNTETGFRIERSSAGGAFTAVGTTAANTATFSDSTVAGSTTYTFRVIAVNSLGDSAPSIAEPVTTPAATTSGAPAPAPTPTAGGGGGGAAPPPAPVGGGGGGGTAPAPSSPAPTPAASDSSASGETAAETPAPVTETPTAPAPTAPPSSPAPAPAPSSEPALASPSAEAQTPASTLAPPPSAKPSPAATSTPSPAPPAAPGPNPAPQTERGGINWLVVGSILAAAAVIGGVTLMSVRRSKGLVGKIKA